ncbi:phosphatidylinositol 5-phosphate 4-kinase type-2 alpha-like [Limulus polyphemus]|uniref:Phosphatidylinositol 5-phosphate 4-kinase type-2 alpha-like n=1 Tax=Limulus polyphemus TaxID=6850 RepID=A0ABM1TI20_LIMPO|nr:phosphatidylinositol 5-phosphate 4-kinase type-2 alpha-like [Limulus polyphemus]
MASAGDGKIVQRGSKFKKKHFKPKYQKTKIFRANEPILSVLMWGVNHSILELNHVSIPVMLMPEDFKAFSKIKVDNHHFNKETLPSHFVVKEYCPLVFRNLRERFGISDEEYVVCLMTQSIGVTTYENNQLIELMYIVERHGKTLLPQFVAMYRLTVEGAETYLAVMRNIFSSSLKIHHKYDLQSKHTTSLKDSDILKDGKTIHIGPEAKERFLESLSADIEFLKKNNLTDYSLCLGIHDCKKAEDEVAEQEKMEADGSGVENGVLPTDDDEDSAGSGLGQVVPTPPDSPRTGELREVNNGSRFITKRDIYAISSYEKAPNPEIYFMGLVDVLTHCGTKRKSTKAGKHTAASEVSTVQLEQYAQGLIEVLNRILE